MSELALQPTTDAATWSLSGSVAVCFHKTRAAGYGAALSAAQRAARYAEERIAGQLSHVAAFGREREQLALALLTIRELRGSRGLQVFAGGRVMQDKWRTEQILECVLTAAACADPRAHCVVMVDQDGWQSPLADRAFPCRYLHQFETFRFHPGHPSSPADQVHAAAVRAGCDWCPHFRTEALPALR